MQDKHANVKVIRSVWRRTKKGYVKVRDLQPEKDVKGGSDIADAMTTFSSIAEAMPLSPSDLPHDRSLHRLKAARDDVIRKLFEMPAERERKERRERIARAQRDFLRWIKRG
jgi:hypothetical protein